MTMHAGSRLLIGLGCLPCLLLLLGTGSPHAGSGTQHEAMSHASEYASWHTEEPIRAQVPTQSAPLPNVQGRFLPEALRILQGQGFQNIRITRWTVDDLPAGLVQAQFPEATPTAGMVAAVRVLPVTTPIWLVVVAEVGEGVMRTDTVVMVETQTQVDTMVVVETQTQVDTVIVVETVEVGAADPGVLPIPQRVVDTVTLVETVESVIVRKVTRWEILAATGLGAGSLTYSATVQVEGAPQALGTLGPRSLALPDGRLDLQPGWPIRHRSLRSLSDCPDLS